VTCILDTRIPDSYGAQEQGLRVIVTQARLRLGLFPSRRVARRAENNDDARPDLHPRLDLREDSPCQGYLTERPQNN
jgi:hypothetical protein